MVDDVRPTLDSTYRCVVHERRRFVLRYLRGAEDGTATVDELVDHVAEQERTPPAPNRDQIAIDLYHVHLPLLADEGVIDFDDRTEVARYRACEELEGLIRPV